MNKRVEVGWCKPDRKTTAEGDRIFTHQCYTDDYACIVGAGNEGGRLVFMTRFGRFNHEDQTCESIHIEEWDAGAVEEDYEEKIQFFAVLRKYASVATACFQEGMDLPTRPELDNPGDFETEKQEIEEDHAGKAAGLLAAVLVVKLWPVKNKHDLPPEARRFGDALQEAVMALIEDGAGDEADGDDFIDNRKKAYKKAIQKALDAADCELSPRQKETLKEINRIGEEAAEELAAASRKAKFSSQTIH